MRALILISLLISAVACDSGKGTRPESTVISVLVRDDRGAPIVRTEVSVMQSPATRMSAKTRNDGTADIGVADAGTYRVWVVPREGYLSTDSLSKSVTVTAHGRTVVEFTLHRVGVSTGNPPVEWTW